ncbi:MAG: PEP/pyruvate-binding domain-containing protein, partial [Desulfatiglandaceae bacterium]
MPRENDNKYILWFNEIGIEDVPLVGGKNASLGEMYQNLESKGIKVPNGFAITAEAYRYFLDYSEIGDEIEKILADLDTGDLDNLMRKGRNVREVIKDAVFPPDL